MLLWYEYKFRYIRYEHSYRQKSESLVFMLKVRIFLFRFKDGKNSIFNRILSMIPLLKRSGNAGIMRVETEFSGGG